MDPSQEQDPLRGSALQADLIVSRTAHILHKRWQAAQILLQHGGSKKDLDDVSLPDPTLYDLAVHRDDWAHLIPSDGDARSELASILATRYSVQPDEIQSLLADEMPPPTGTSSLQVVDQASADVIAELDWVYQRRGEILFAQGSAADKLYVIVDGLVCTGSVDAEGHETTGVTLGSGSIAGALALLTDEPHLVTARAIRDSDICCLPGSSFQRLVQRYPALMTQIAVRMANFLRADLKPPESFSRATVTAVLPASAGIGGFIERLVQDLARYGPTMHMDSASMQEELRRHVDADLEDFVDEYGFVDWLRRQAADHRNVLYIADAAFPKWTQRSIEQADRILIVARAGESPELSAVEALVAALPDPDLLAPSELVLLHESTADMQGDTRAWLAPRDVIRHHHVALDSGAGVDRVSRFLRGRALALVIGGGGMRSVAGIGAVRVLEEHGIVADVVGGTSGGAIAAALYAMGMSSDEAIAITRDKLMKRNILVQPTLPFVSVASAQRLVEAYHEVFGDYYMEDLWITPFTISGNLTQAKMMVHTHGLLRHGVRASTSLAGIMPPALTEEGDLLIDGGIFDNTPADVAREMVETGPVIAVDLGFTVRQRIAYDYGESLSGWKVLRSRLNPFAAKIETPSIVGIMMRANALGSINATVKQITYADLLLQPPVSDYGLFDFEVFDTIVDSGYEYAKPLIEAWLEAGGLDGS